MSAASLRYDVVGCGAVVQVVHVPILRHLQQESEITIGTCYDRNQKLATRVAEMLGAEDTGGEAAPREDDGVDAALIATPPASHAAIAGEYAQLGKSAFVEKPLAPTASEVEMLVDGSRAAGARIAVNQFWRFSPSTEIARRLLRDQLGRVESVEASEGFRFDWSPVSDYVVKDRLAEYPRHRRAPDHAVRLPARPRRAGGGADGGPRGREGPGCEPSHECRARVGLGMQGGRSVPVDLTMSRLRPVARGIKVRGSFGVLFVPQASPRCRSCFASRAPSSCTREPSRSSRSTSRAASCSRTASSSRPRETAPRAGSTRAGFCSVPDHGGPSRRGGELMGTVVVFGASSYVGGFVVDVLLERGHRVVGVDSATRARTNPAGRGLRGTHRRHVRGRDSAGEGGGLDRQPRLRQERPAPAHLPAERGAERVDRPPRRRPLPAADPHQHALGVRGRTRRAAGPGSGFPGVQWRTSTPSRRSTPST